MDDKIREKLIEAGVDVDEAMERFMGHYPLLEKFLKNNQTIRQLKYFDYQYDFLQSDEFILSAKSLTLFFSKKSP